MDARELDLVALDMDGTLLNSAHGTTALTRDALKRTAAAGKVIALCTGRCLSELWDHLAVLPGVAYAICENGGCLYDVAGRRVIEQISMDDAVAARLIDTAAGFDVCVQCFIGGQSYMQIGDIEALRRYHIYEYAPIYRDCSRFIPDMRAQWRALGTPVEKVILYFAEAQGRDRYLQQIGAMDLQITDSLGIGWEISPARATKARGLAALCARLGIPVARAMAVGDGGNDLDLMRAAGFSVAMGNATDAVRAAADALTDDCDHDGAARAMLRYMLGEEL